MTDTLAFWDDDLGTHVFDPNRRQTFRDEYELAESDFRGQELTPEAVERLYDRIYGAGWRAGNPDGSKYQPLELRVEILEGPHKGTVLVKTEPRPGWTPG